MAIHIVSSMELDLHVISCGYDGAEETKKRHVSKIQNLGSYFAIIALH